MYGEMSDQHLKDLSREPENLTDSARMVLEDELAKRGLHTRQESAHRDGLVTPDMEPVAEPIRETGFSAGIPGMFPASAAVMEQALEEPQRTKDGMTSLISFYDGIELGKACAILEDEQMEPVIEPIAGDAQTGVPPRFEVWLHTAEIDRAKALLRRKMGLFPLAEMDGEDFSDEVATGLVAVFETHVEAERVRVLLVEQGIPAEVEQDTELSQWEVTVAPEQQERAVELVAGGLGIG
jgi:hypothetical protein